MGACHEANETINMSIHVSWFLPVQHRDYNRMPASVWIRCLQLLPYLQAQGVQSLINHSDSDTQIAAFVRFQDDDAYNIALRQKAAGRKVIFDLCVNYFDETGYLGTGYGTPKERVIEAKRMVEIADVVTCASETIARRAREFHHHVICLADSIDLQHFHYTKAADDFLRPTLRAIWSGIAEKAYELEPILPLLRQHNIELTLITNAPPKLTLQRWFGRQRMPYHFFPWAYDTFPANLLEGEICVSYRAVDTPYNQGHSFFKIGVFMAQGIPAIASPVPSYQELLDTPFGGGRICHSLKDWQHIFSAIQEDRQLLETWSRQGRDTMAKYSTEVIAMQYTSLLKKLCSTC